MKKIALLFAVALIGFTACEKENEPNAPKNNAEADYPILKFGSEEEFANTLGKIAAFENEQQREAWESSMGFRSFGSICDDFYYSINPDQFSSFEEAKAFIESNSWYLSLVQDENGDYYCEPKGFRNPERYLWNEDGMYIIADKAYKMLEGKYVASSVDDMELLKKTTSLLQASADNNLLVVEGEQMAHTKATKAAGPTKDEAQSDFTIDKQRYRLKVWIEAQKSGGSWLGTMSVKTMHRKLMIYWFMDAPINYTYRHVLTDGKVSLESTRTSSNWITKNNYDPFLVIRHSGPNLGDPYYQSYNISVTNSVTYKGTTKGTTVNLIR